VNANKLPFADSHALVNRPFVVVAVDTETVTAQASMLRLPVFDQAGFDAVPADEYVASRLQELEFGTASQALRELARRGDAQGVQATLD